MPGPTSFLERDVDALVGRVTELEVELHSTQAALQESRAQKEALEGRVRALLLEMEAKDRTILHLGREVDDLRQQVFGRSSEKEGCLGDCEDACSGAGGEGGADDPGGEVGLADSSTGDGPGEETSEEGPGPGVSAPANERPGDERDTGQDRRRGRKRSHGQRRPLSKDLPRRRVEVYPSAEDLICPCCGKPRRLMKGAEEVSERVDYVPASVVVLEIVRFKFSCATCEEGGVAIGPPPPSLIERGRPTAGMLAYAITAKFCDLLPLNRLERILGRHGLEINRSTLSGWQKRSAFELRPVVAEMTRQLLDGDLVRFDETGQPVLDREAPDGIVNGRMWAYRRGPGEVVFVYSRTKAHNDPRGPKQILADYHGFLQADAAPIFDVLFEDGERVEVGCNAHGRRRFVKAKKSEPEAARWVLRVYQQIYRVEAKATSRGYSPELRLALRQVVSAPLVALLYEQLERWQADETFLPKSAMGEAISYALNHREALCRFLEDGRLPIDNNDTERALRQVVVGRKNSLFAGSEAGAEDAAVLYSLTQSCRELGLDPFAYLRDVLEKLAAGFPSSRIAELTPKGWKEAQEERAPRAPP